MQFFHIWPNFLQWISAEIPSRISSGVPPNILQGSLSRFTLKQFPGIVSEISPATLTRNPPEIRNRVSFSSYFSKISPIISLGISSKILLEIYFEDLSRYYSKDFIRNAYSVSTWNVSSDSFRNVSKNLLKIFFRGFPLNLQDVFLDEHLKEFQEHLEGFLEKSPKCFIATYVKIHLEEFSEISRLLGEFLDKSTKEYLKKSLKECLDKCLKKLLHYYSWRNPSRNSWKNPLRKSHRNS